MFLPATKPQAPKPSTLKKPPAPKPATRPAPAPQGTLVTKAVDDLIKRQVGRPATLKTLLNTIHATCGKELPDEQIQSVYGALVKRGYVTLDGTRVIYHLPGLSTCGRK